jgi:hypothetical protein
MFFYKNSKTIMYFLLIFEMKYKVCVYKRIVQEKIRKTKTYTKFMF